MPIVDVKRLMKEFGITDRWVHRLVESGMPKTSHGKYDLLICYRWYVHFLQAAVRKRSLFTEADGEKSLAQERLRRLAAEADLKEIELAKQRGQLIALDDIEKTLTDLVLTTKACIMAIAPRLAPELVGETSRVVIQAKLEKALKEALSYLAKAGSDAKSPNTEAAEWDRSTTNP
jgi:phage terminase Nu1 subunit (DNA packaging protein)